jgi:hypothetical protein
VRRALALAARCAAREAPRPPSLAPGPRPFGFSARASATGLGLGQPLSSLRRGREERSPRARARVLLVRPESSHELRITRSPDEQAEPGGPFWRAGFGAQDAKVAKMGLAFSKVFARLFSKKEMRILMVRPRRAGARRAPDSALDGPAHLRPPCAGRSRRSGQDHHPLQAEAGRDRDHDPHDRCAGHSDALPPVAGSPRRGRRPGRPSADAWHPPSAPPRRAPPRARRAPLTAALLPSRPRRLQRRDGGVQEHFLHGLGRGRPGQGAPGARAAALGRRRRAAGGGRRAAGGGRRAAGGRSPPRNLHHLDALALDTIKLAIVHKPPNSP